VPALRGPRNSRRCRGKSPPGTPLRNSPNPLWKAPHQRRGSNFGPMPTQHCQQSYCSRCARFSAPGSAGGPPAARAAPSRRARVRGARTCRPQKRASRPRAPRTRCAHQLGCGRQPALCFSGALRVLCAAEAVGVLRRPAARDGSSEMPVPAEGQASRKDAA